MTNTPHDPLNQLGTKIKAAQDAHQPDSARVPHGMELGMRMVFELLGGVAVGGFIGWQLDQWLQTAPWLLIVCLLFGLTAGMVSMIRTAQRYKL
jgi:F0F1-type ATP synthase assembly protein I